YSSIASGALCTHPFHPVPDGALRTPSASTLASRSQLPSAATPSRLPLVCVLPKVRLCSSRELAHVVPLCDRSRAHPLRHDSRSCVCATEAHTPQPLVLVPAPFVRGQRLVLLQWFRVHFPPVVSFVVVEATVPPC